MICPGSYCLTHEESVPVFICDTCSKRDESWKRFYEDYLNLFSVKENWQEPKHRVSCVLGLFCYLYKKKYGVDYLFVPSTPNPFSAKECRDANLLVSAFNKNMDDVRKYLVWVFKTGLGSNAKIVSLAYVNAPGLIRRYMLSADRKNTYTRNSPLPEEFLEWCKASVPVIISSYTFETMNDLGALLGYVNADSELQPSSPEILAINKAKELRLVINGVLNVEAK